jgi:cytochrome P450
MPDLPNFDPGADMTNVPVDDLDLFGAHYQADPARWNTELRAAGPVHWLSRNGWFLVTTDELVREVLRDAVLFSSSVHKHTQPPAEAAERVADIRAQGWPYMPALGTTDAPGHTRLRKLVQRAFTPRSIAWMEPLVRQAAEDLAAELPDGAQLDLVTAFSEALPVWAISKVLGLPDSRRVDIRRWSAAATASIGGMPDPDSWVEHERTLLHFQQTMAAELEDVRRNPREGLLSTLVAAADSPEAGDEPVPMAQLLTLVRELVVAGNETSGRLITEMVRLLDRRPDEWQRIRAEPERARLVVEEALRWATPAQTVFRRAVVDTRLGDVDIPAGSTVVVSLASANRDERAYAAAEEFEPDRTELQQHVAFGLGAHACLGSPLARMEAVIAAQVLVEQLESLAVLDPQDLHYSASFMVRGLLDLPVRVRRRTTS